MIGLTHYLAVAAAIFTLGVLGIFLNRRNVILMLMAIELILLAVNINLVAFSAFLGDLVGQVFAMFVLTVAAAEAAIGLAILVIFFRRRGSIAGTCSRGLVMVIMALDHLRACFTTLPALPVVRDLKARSRAWWPSYL